MKPSFLLQAAEFEIIESYLKLQRGRFKKQMQTEQGAPDDDFVLTVCDLFTPSKDPCRRSGSQCCRTTK